MVRLRSKWTSIQVYPSETGYFVRYYQARFAHASRELHSQLGRYYLEAVDQAVSKQLAAVDLILNRFVSLGLISLIFDS